MSFITTSWDWLFDRLTWMWPYLIFMGIFLEIVWYYWTVLRAWDVKWNTDLAEVFKSGRRRKFPIKFNKAFTRVYSIPLFVMPVFVGWVFSCLAIMDDFSWGTYLAISTLWLLTVPVREMALIFSSRKARQRRGKEVASKGFPDAVRQWYSAGLRLPGEEDKEPLFEGRLRFLNFLQKFRYVFHVFRFWGIVVQMLGALAWPVVALWSMLHYVDKTDYDLDPPWWRLDLDLRDV